MRGRDIRQQRREAEAQKYIGFTPVDDDDEPSGPPPWPRICKGHPVNDDKATAALFAEIDRLRSDRDCEKRLRKDAEEARENLIVECDRLRAQVAAMREDAERWLPAPGFNGSYEVSSLGRVRSLDRIDSDGNRRKGRFLNPSAIRKGYLKVSLWSCGTQSEVYVHRLVATAFLPNPASLPQVNHRDGDPGNNAVSNLEWVTNQENSIHASRVLFRNVRPVRGVSKTDGSEILFQSLSLAAEAGFVPADIQKCIEGTRKHHRGYAWFDAAIDRARESGRATTPQEGA